jgi:hypothetical protein
VKKLICAFCFFTFSFALFSDLQAYAAEQAGKYTISGFVTDKEGVGIYDIEIKLTGDSTDIKRTDTTGYYRFDDIDDGSKVELAAKKEGHSIAPSVFRISSLNSNRTINFKAVKIADIASKKEESSASLSSAAKAGETKSDAKAVQNPAYEISGKVSYYASGIIGVKVSVNNDKKLTAVTDSNGNYSIKGVRAQEGAVVSFSKEGFVFNPSESDVSSINSDIVINSEAAQTTFKISGVISEGKNLIKDVSVRITNGVDNFSALTDSKGYYEIIGLPHGSNLFIAAFKDEVVITPLKLVINKLDGNKTVNFSANVRKLKISGTVFDENGDPVKNSKVVLNTPFDSFEAETNAKGAYLFNRVPSVFSFSIKASKEGYEDSQEINSEPLDSDKIINLTMIESDDAIETKAAKKKKERRVKKDAEPQPPESDEPKTPLKKVSVRKIARPAQDEPVKTEKAKLSKEKIAKEKSEEKTVRKEKNAEALKQKNKKMKTVRIRGTVSGKLAALSGVELTLEPGGYSVKTDDKGKYVFEAIPENSRYVLKPYLQDVNFEPENAVFEDVSSNIIQDFTPYVTIEGETFFEGKYIDEVSINLNAAPAALSNKFGKFKISPVEYGSSVSLGAEKSGYAFYPPVIRIPSITKNYDKQNFMAAFSVSGKISLYGGNNGLSNIELEVTGNTQTSVFTDYGGNYYIQGLEAGGTFTVTPKAGGYKFTPASKDYAALKGNFVNQDFTAVKETYTITGNVNIGGKPVRNAVVNITKRTLKYFTDDEGKFEIRNLDYGGPYTLSVQSPGYSFKPIVIEILKENTAVEFSTDLSLSGIVTSGGKPVKDVIVDVNGSKYKTDENGKYTIKGLKYGGSYLVSLLSKGMMFEPFHKEYNNLRQSVLDESFEASLIISGRITYADSAFEGAAVAVRGISEVYKTDANGYYTISAAKVGRDYTVEVSSPGYKFLPAKREYKDLSESKMSENFQAVSLGYRVKGKVTAEGRALKRVQVIIEGSSKAQTYTDDEGYYIFKGLASDKKYMLTVVSKNYQFENPSGIIMNLTGDTVINLEFGKVTSPEPVAQNLNESLKHENEQTEAKEKFFTVEGIVTVNDMPAKDVAVKSGSLETFTDEDGKYSLSVSAGDNITAEPYLDGYSFTPEKISFSGVSSNKTGINFSGAQTKFYSVEGSIVNDELRGVKGVLVKILNDSSTVATDSSGFYKIAGLKHNEKNIIAFESDRYDFYPQSLEITPLDDVKAGDIFAYPKKLKRPQLFIYGASNSQVNASLAKEIAVVMVADEDGKVSGQIIDENDNSVFEFNDDLLANAPSAAKWNMVSSSSRKKVPSGEYSVILNGAGFKDETVSFKIIR